MSTRVKSKKGLNRLYESQSARIKAHYEHLPRLLSEFPLTVSLSYAFAQLELAQNMAIYCGIVRIYRTQSELTRRVLNTHHMTRQSFKDLYLSVYGLNPPHDAAKALEDAEKTRDLVMHGKKTNDDRVRNSIAQVLEYSNAINEQLANSHRIEPFGSLSGFSGAAKKIDAKTTRLILKGIGLAVK